MVTKLQKFIESKLLSAQYEYDSSVKQWVGWVRGFPGVYGQGDSVEAVRQELAEMVEEYVLTSLQEKRKISGFSFSPIFHYAKTA